MRACSLTELPEEGALKVHLDGRDICVARSHGTVYAIGDTCSHADVSLSEGDVEDGTIECWLHGSRFDLRTGAPIGLPATKSVPTYPVTVIGDDVFLKLEKK
ncbi:MAG TPA: non-heme iron oxygenase ferredoxin subunit [Mycobacteriales bacterium]|jgi:3-phenylpropionate/trans-cinnamate dioxygenase ferredoxin subunit|nr:non-heme iron oxygenase ferredoxin subunit [Mycobacteriales bacterium]